MRIDHLFKSLGVTFIISAMAACDPWADHLELSDPNLDNSVMDVMKEQSDLSLFVQVLEKTGYDSILSLAQAYTVFAPVNEAMALLDTTDLDLMCAYMENHIAYQSIPLTNDSFSVSKVQMLNGKYIPVSGSSVDGHELTQWNIKAGNGIIHKISVAMEPRMTIWEYINQSAFASFNQVQFLNDQTQQVMDVEDSYLLYLDEMGRPVYDTAWVETNEWLSTYALDNEDSTYTFLLLDASAYAALSSKYTPYFSVYSTTISEGIHTPTILPTQTANSVLSEITRDMIVLPVSLSGGETVFSIDGVKVTVPTGAIDQSYRASNGMVYLVGSVQVKMFENKVKEIVLEGEDYLSSNVASTIISKRFNDWASGNYDVVLSGRDAGGYYALSSQSTTYYSNILNSYLAFAPTLNSVDYKVYWKSYDDLAAHVAAGINIPQKLFFSVPGAPTLTWATGGVVTNNFNDSLVFIGQNTAGMNVETALSMWVTTGTTTRIAREALSTHPDFAIDRLPCYSYGTASLWVSNNAFSTSNTTGGSLFLDYIRLVPVVDPDE